MSCEDAVADAVADGGAPAGAGGGAGAGGVPDTSPAILSTRTAATRARLERPEGMDGWRIVLGTKSSTRRQVLTGLGVKYVAMKADIDEKAVRHEDPQQLPVVVAQAKAQALLPKLAAATSESEGAGCDYLITADQVVLIGGVVHEKPADIAEARSFMQKYSGGSLQSVSALVVTHVPSQRQVSGVDVVTITFETIPDDDIAKAIADGEGDVMWCSGALCVEDPAIAPHVTSMDGDEDSVFGLPSQLLWRLFHEIQAE